MTLIYRTSRIQAYQQASLSRGGFLFHNSYLNSFLRKHISLKALTPKRAKSVKIDDYGSFSGYFFQFSKIHSSMFLLDLQHFFWGMKLVNLSEATLKQKNLLKTFLIKCEP